MRQIFKFIKGTYNDIRNTFKEDHTLANWIFVIIIAFISITSFFHVMQYWSLTNKTPFDVITAVATELIILGSMLAIRYTRAAWIPFIIGTLVQAVGNIFYSFISIDVESVKFIQFMELFQPWFQLMYGDELEIANYKRLLAYSNGLFYLSPIVFLYAKLKLGGHIKVLKINPPEDPIPPSTPDDLDYVEPEPKVIEPEAETPEEVNLADITPEKNTDDTDAPEIETNVNTPEEVVSTDIPETETKDELKKKWIERMSQHLRPS